MTLDVSDYPTVVHNAKQLHIAMGQNAYCTPVTPRSKAIERGYHTSWNPKKKQGSVWTNGRVTSCSGQKLSNHLTESITHSICEDDCMGVSER